MDFHEAKGEPDHPAWAMYKENLGKVLLSKGERQRGLSVLREALGIRSRSQGNGHPDTEALAAFLEKVESEGNSDVE